jgi:hypothetical protein
MKNRDFRWPGVDDQETANVKLWSKDEAVKADITVLDSRPDCW